MTRKQKRLSLIAGGVGFVAAAVLLVLFAFGQAVAYFYVPATCRRRMWRPERASGWVAWWPTARSSVAAA